MNISHAKKESQAQSRPGEEQALRQPRKLGADVGDRAHKMPRDTALLYRNRTPRDEAAAHYRGLVTLRNGDQYWVGLWVRSLRGQPVLEIKLRLRSPDGDAG